MAPESILCLCSHADDCIKLAFNFTRVFFIIFCWKKSFSSVSQFSWTKVSHFPIEPMQSCSPNPGQCWIPCHPYYHYCAMKQTTGVKTMLMTLILSLSNHQKWNNVPLLGYGTKTTEKETALFDTPAAVICMSMSRSASCDLERCESWKHTVVQFSVRQQVNQSFD